MVRVDAVLNSWSTVRDDMAQAVLDMPAGDLAFQPAPELMTYGDIARHCLNAGHALTVMLLDGGANMAAPDFRERMKSYFVDLAAGAGPAELAALLKQVLAEDVARLRSQTPEFYSGVVTRFDGQQVTRLEMVQFIKEHELTHRSQMFVYLRLKGVVPPTTRRKMQKQ